MADPQQRQYTHQQFGATIKAQYPQYAKWSDDQIADAMLQQYPQYRSWISPSQQTSPASRKPFVPDPARLAAEGVRIVGRNAAGQPILAPASDPQGSAAGRFGSSTWEQLKQPFVGLYHGLVEGPQNPEEAAIEAQNPFAGRAGLLFHRFVGGPMESEARQTAEEFRQANEFAPPWKRTEEEKRHGTLMAGHALATAVPFIGPGAAQAGEQAGRQYASGDVSGALGTGVGTVAPYVLGGPASRLAVKAVKGIRPGALPTDPVMVARAAGRALDPVTTAGTGGVTGLAEDLQTYRSELTKEPFDLRGKWGFRSRSKGILTAIERRSEALLEPYAKRYQGWLDKIGNVRMGATEGETYPSMMDSLHDNGGIPFKDLAIKDVKTLSDFLKDLNDQSKPEFLKSPNEVTRLNAGKSLRGANLLREKLNRVMGRELGKTPEEVGDVRERTGAFSNIMDKALTRWQRAAGLKFGDESPSGIPTPTKRGMWHAASELVQGGPIRIAERQVAKQWRALGGLEEPSAAQPAPQVDEPQTPPPAASPPSAPPVFSPEEIAEQRRQMEALRQPMPGQQAAPQVNERPFRPRTTPEEQAELNRQAIARQEEFRRQKQEEMYGGPPEPPPPYTPAQGVPGAGVQPRAVPPPSAPTGPSTLKMPTWQEMLQRSEGMAPQDPEAEAIRQQNWRDLEERSGRGGRTKPASTQTRARQGGAELQTEIAKAKKALTEANRQYREAQGAAAKEAAADRVRKAKNDFDQLTKASRQ